jgi:hypothetical protein
MGQRPPIRPIESPGATPFLRADLRLATPKLGRGVVEEGDAAFRVGRVDRHRQRLQQFARLPFPDDRLDASEVSFDFLRRETAQDTYSSKQRAPAI